MLRAAVGWTENKTGQQKSSRVRRKASVYNLRLHYSSVLTLLSATASLLKKEDGNGQLFALLQTSRYTGNSLYRRKPPIFALCCENKFRTCRNQRPTCGWSSAGIAGEDEYHRELRPSIAVDNRISRWMVTSCAMRKTAMPHRQTNFLFSYGRGSTGRTALWV